MAISIKVIAQLAGVSHSTVSRALRDSPLIPSATAERIKLIAKQHGYSASAVARSLVTKRTQAVGVVVTSIADPFNGEVVDGIEQVANQHGYSVILATSQALPERELMVVRSFQERRVDGIVVASSRLGSHYMSLLSELEVPIVLLNNQHPGMFVHSVSIDNASGTYAATRHLISLGHNRIAYLGDQLGLESDSERFHGFQQAMSEAQLEVPVEFILKGDGKREGAAQACRALLDSGDRPTAIVCYNDMSALGVMDVAANLELSIPLDLSIVGFDDLFFTSALQPPLTTIRQPKKELGVRSMELLLALLKGEAADKHEVLQGELVVRGSTDAPKGRTYQAISAGKNSDTRSS
jgi:DNA-binding LacI/PurR family transcriptional regulator